MSKAQLVLDKLREHITPERANRIHETAKMRTRYFRVAIEDIEQDNNAGAVIRTCDCFGVQEVSVIENNFNTLVANSISKGSDKWLDITKWDAPNTDNTIRCINQLKADGFQVVATSPHNPDVDLPDFEITQPTAFLFGTEVNGLSETALEMADVRLRIPIHGFTESFNISVSAALVLQQNVEKLHRSNLPWQMSPEELIALETQWIVASIGSLGPGILAEIEKSIP